MTPPTTRKKSATPDWAAASQTPGKTADTTDSVESVPDETTSQLRPRRAVRPEAPRYARTYRLPEDTLNVIEALYERATEAGERISRERIVERAVSAYAQQQTD